MEQLPIPQISTEESGRNFKYIKYLVPNLKTSFIESIDTLQQLGVEIFSMTTHKLPGYDLFEIIVYACCQNNQIIELLNHQDYIFYGSG